MKQYLIILLLIIPTWLYSQSLNTIKHVEIISELQDSMVLLNKQDVDKINKTFYDLKQLDSLKKLHLEMISCLEIKNSKLDSIISEQKVIIQNEVKIRTRLEEQTNNTIESYKKKYKKEKIKKICWQSATGVCLLTFLIILL